METKMNAREQRAMALINLAIACAVCTGLILLVASVMNWGGNLHMSQAGKSLIQLAAAALFFTGLVSAFAGAGMFVLAQVRDTDRTQPARPVRSAAPGDETLEERFARQAAARRKAQRSAR